jgi:hypothetical protein
MRAKVGYLVIDAADPAVLARFWCGLLAVTVDTEIGDGEFLVLSPTEDGLTVGFQRVADAKLGKNRVHPDLVVDDLDQSTAEIEKLGGRWLEPGNTRELEGFPVAVHGRPRGQRIRHRRPPRGVERTSVSGCARPCDVHAVRTGRAPSFFRTKPVRPPAPAAAIP